MINSAVSILNKGSDTVKYYSTVNTKIVFADSGHEKDSDSLQN